jgi:hypothetical protein
MGNGMDDLLAVVARTKRRQVSGKDRACIYHRYDGKCVFCPPEMGELPLNGWHCDHLDPFSQSGDSSLDNLVPACPRHNLEKSDGDPVRWLGIMKDVNPPAYRMFCAVNGLTMVVEPLIAAPVAVVTFEWKQRWGDWDLYPRLRWRCPNEETKCWERFHDEYDNQRSRCPDCLKERPWLSPANIRAGLIRDPASGLKQFYQFSPDDFRHRGAGTKAHLRGPGRGRAVTEYDPFDPENM